MQLVAKIFKTEKFDEALPKRFNLCNGNPLYILSKTNVSKENVSAK